MPLSRDNWYISREEIPAGCSSSNSSSVMYHRTQVINGEKSAWTSTKCDTLKRRDLISVKTKLYPPGTLLLSHSWLSCPGDQSQSERCFSSSCSCISCLQHKVGQKHGKCEENLKYLLTFFILFVKIFWPKSSKERQGLAGGFWMYSTSSSSRTTGVPPTPTRSAPATRPRSARHWEGPPLGAVPAGECYRTGHLWFSNKLLTGLACAAASPRAVGRPSTSTTPTSRDQVSKRERLRLYNVWLQVMTVLRARPRSVSAVVMSATSDWSSPHSPPPAPSPPPTPTPTLTAGGSARPVSSPSALTGWRLPSSAAPTLDITW